LGTRYSDVWSLEKSMASKLNGARNRILKTLTLRHSRGIGEKFAVDIKSTYRRPETEVN